jgi:hypothetical protein
MGPKMRMMWASAQTRTAAIAGNRIRQQKVNSVGCTDGKVNGNAYMYDEDCRTHVTYALYHDDSLFHFSVSAPLNA